MHIHLFIVWGEGGGIGKINIFQAIFGTDKELQGITWVFFPRRRDIRGFWAKNLGEMPNVFQKPSEMLIFLGKNKP